LGDRLKKEVPNENFAEDIEKLTNNKDTVLLTINRDYQFPKGLIEREMSSLYKLDSQVDFAYFKIYRFVKKKN